jgi:hypothetical protein
MKNYLPFFLVFLFPLLSMAQPDWINDYELPAQGQEFFINDCSFLDDIDLGITDQFDTVDYIIHTSEDSIVYNASYECIKVHRTVSILEWLLGEVYFLNMTFTINSTPCVMDVYIDIEGRNEVDVRIEDVVGSSVADEFAFSISDQNHDNITLSTDRNHTIYGYNHITNDICLFNINFTPCGPDFALETEDMVPVDMNQDKCATVDIQDVLLEFNYDCGTYQLGFFEDGMISSETVLAYKMMDRLVERTIIFISEQQDTLYRFITFSLEADIDPTYTIILAGDDYYNEGDTGYIEIGGEANNLLAFAGRVHLNGIQGLHVSNIHPNLLNGHVNQYNINDTMFAFIWEGPGILEPKNLPGNEPWFRFHFVAEEDGNISDLIDLSTSFIDEIFFSGAYCDAVYRQSVEYIFTDNLLSSQENPNRNSQITVYPNPASSQLQIAGWKGTSAKVKLFTMDGKQVLTKSYSSTVAPLTLPINTISNGIYVMQISEREGKWSDRRIIIVQH